MRGVDNIVKMRLNGMVPNIVFVEMLPQKAWARGCTTRPDRHVEIHMNDEDALTVARADLRCLCGVPFVIISGPNQGHTEAVARACFKAGAKHVEAYFLDTSKPEHAWITRYLTINESGESDKWQG